MVEFRLSRCALEQLTALGEFLADELSFHRGCGKSGLEHHVAAPDRPFGLERFLAQGDQRATQRP